MKSLRASWCVLGLIAWFSGCSTEDNLPPPSAVTGGSSSTGGLGAKASSGGATGSGGTATGGSGTSGGTPPVGGTSSGGAGGSGLDTGGAPAQGGSGGAPALGGSSGAPAGGAPSAGSAGVPSAGGGGGGGGGPVAEEPKLVTSADNAFWKVGTLTTGATGTAEVTVSATGTQSWLGFGGTFNEAGWDALSVLPEEQRL